MDPPHVTTAPVAATTPVVLRILPLLGSQAPIGYIYYPTPASNGDGGLLAAASAFFVHQGHQVFLDPCPDLAAYHRAGGVAEPIIDVDRLPDHVLSAGLNLLESSPASSAVDSLGLSFMAAYLLAPAPVVPHGLVSLSPMGGDTTGQPFSAFSSSCSGGSEAGGRSRSFRQASPSSRSVTHSTHPTPSLGNAHRRPDPEPCKQVFIRAPSYGSGRVPFYGSPCPEGARTPRTSTPTAGVLRLLTDILLISGGVRTPRTSTRAIGVVLLLTPHCPIKSPPICASPMSRWFFPLIPRIRQLLLLRRRSRP
jgi:hypothetical protein